MCRTPWNKDSDTPIGTVELVGAISTKTLLTNKKIVLRLKKGDFIPNTRARLQADNLAVKFDNLNHDWDEIIKYMVSNNPPDLSVCIISI